MTSGFEERLSRAVCSANELDYEYESALDLARAIDEIIQVIDENPALQDKIQAQLEQFTPEDRRLLES